VPNRSCCLTASTDLQAELFERYIHPLMRGIAVGGVAFNIPQTFDEFFNCLRSIVRKLPKEQQSEDDTRTLGILWHTEVRHRLAHLLHLPGTRAATAATAKHLSAFGRRHGHGLPRPPSLRLSIAQVLRKKRAGGWRAR
jgi:hypothetical protein